jgi:cell division protein FtsB
LDVSIIWQSILGPLGALALALVIVWALYKQGQGKDKEIDELQAENKQLWREKVDDAKSSEAIARAYIELRNREEREGK